MASMQDLKEEAELAVAIEASEMNLVRLLGLHPYPDGNMWCVLWGESLQEGVAGFGETPQLAVWEFNKNFRAETANKGSGMIYIERNIKYFHLRGSIHLGLFYVYFGKHRGKEKWFAGASKAHWLSAMMSRRQQSRDRSTE